MSTHKIRGDWMRDGYIDNLGRRRWVEIEAVDGRAYLSEAECGHSAHIIAERRALNLDVDGQISAWGSSITFAPDEGEIERLQKLGACIPLAA